MAKKKTRLKPFFPPHPVESTACLPLGFALSAAIERNADGRTERRERAPERGAFETALSTGGGDKKKKKKKRRQNRKKVKSGEEIEKPLRPRNRQKNHRKNQKETDPLLFILLLQVRFLLFTFVF